MKYSTIQYVDKPVSHLVQGTMMMNESDPESGFAILDACLAAGINTFDTAHVYGGGQSERVLGSWINERGVRDQVVVLTKGAHHSRDRKRVTPFDIAADIHDSLARMRAAYLRYAEDRVAEKLVASML